MELKMCDFNELSVEELYKIAQARFDVFVCEQKVIDEPELDGKDYHCKHIFYIDGDKVAAYCRIVPKGIGYDYISIGRVLVRKEYRRKGLAQKMMSVAIKYIEEELKEEKIILSAQVYAKGLYESVGFKVISDVYMEAGIEHVKMIK